MLDQRGLRQAGRAARVDVASQLVEPQRTGAVGVVRGAAAESCCMLGASTQSPRSGSTSAIAPRARFAELRADRRERRPQLRADCDALRARTRAARVPGLRRSRLVLIRLATAPSLCSANRCHRYSGPILQHQRDHVAAPDAERAIRVRVAIDRGVRLGVRVRALAEQQEAHVRDRRRAGARAGARACCWTRAGTGAAR